MAQLDINYTQWVGKALDLPGLGMHVNNAGAWQWVGATPAGLALAQRVQSRARLVGFVVPQAAPVANGTALYQLTPSRALQLALQYNDKGQVTEVRCWVQQP